MDGCGGAPETYGAGVGGRETGGPSCLLSFATWVAMAFANYCLYVTSLSVHNPAVKGQGFRTNAARAKPERRARRGRRAMHFTFKGWE
jgi:hypothetical protein